MYGWLGKWTHCINMANTFCGKLWLNIYYNPNKHDHHKQSIYIHCCLRLCFVINSWQMINECQTTTSAFGEFTLSYI